MVRHSGPTWQRRPSQEEERLLGALRHARSTRQPDAVARAEDALFRYFLPVAGSVAAAHPAHRTDRVRVLHAAEAGLARAILGWSGRDVAGFAAYVRQTIAGQLRRSDLLAGRAGTAVAAGGADDARAFPARHRAPVDPTGRGRPPSVGADLGGPVDRLELTDRHAACYLRATIDELVSDLGGHYSDRQITRQAIRALHDLRSSICAEDLPEMVGRLVRERLRESPQESPATGGDNGGWGPGRPAGENAGPRRMLSR